MTTEEEIVLAAQAGDRQAFAELVERHKDWVYRLCYAIVRSHAEADDATQETMIHAWRELPKLRRADAWAGWLRRIAVRAAIDTTRSRPRTREVDPGAAPFADPATEAAGRDEMERALLRLEPRDRALVALRFYLDLDVPAVAATMGIPVGTAKSRLHRTLAHLRTVLESEP